MTDSTNTNESIETAADAVKKTAENDVKAEEKAVKTGIIAHLEAFGELAEADVKAALAWLQAKL